LIGRDSAARLRQFGVGLRSLDLRGRGKFC
jgi:hypothetical protein